MFETHLLAESRPTLSTSATIAVIYTEKPILVHNNRQFLDLFFKQKVWTDIYC